MLAVLLGAAPGCLGAFVIVTLFEHRIVSTGALIVTMIATSGDEAFVMLALMPRTFVVLTGRLMGIAALAGGGYLHATGCQPVRSSDVYEVHGEICHCYPRGHIAQQLRHCTLARATLAVVVALFVAVLLTGDVGPSEWNWVCITLLLTSAVGSFHRGHRSRPLSGGAPVGACSQTTCTAHLRLDLRCSARDRRGGSSLRSGRVHAGQPANGAPLCRPHRCQTRIRPAPDLLHAL